MVGLSLVKEANVQRYAAVVALRDAILATNLGGRQAALKRITDGRTKSLELMNEARGKASDPETLAAFAKVEEAWKADQAALDGVLKLLASSEMQIDSPVLDFLGASVVQPARVSRAPRMRGSQKSLIWLANPSTPSAWGLLSMNLAI